MAETIRRGSARRLQTPLLQRNVSAMVLKRSHIVSSCVVLMHFPASASRMEESEISPQTGLSQGIPETVSAIVYKTEPLDYGDGSIRLPG